ncbi:unnamed protein product [Arabidopsis lyrata]|uniref:Senescence-associated gene 101 n=1 Tax=Arabidopsis lyrata subsp. lyrata TaxID=81972 RepID=D7M6P3_ARALL|nr:senescence-associated carboxylesterase 101 [Arabidopsis lyrata subsp. lyrata]EFH47897.1 senescence-associated gene 101 [Arabidopsis lyrata subsp. lyrata]CAH8271125.1 unnamed protein product [Arabidopsis lyrata]|eukprot:XP_020878034.1 senescence-associated carboxylesterase 101 [Arabidopsis lyrata subsp. lyrata]
MESSSSSSLKCSALGKLVLSSGLLHSSWSKISEIHKSPYSNQDSGLGIKIYREEKFTLVVFVAPPIFTSSSDSTLLPGKENENPFPFLCSEINPSFSLHTPALNLFTSAYKSLTNLQSELLQTLKSEKPVIITGASLGGSVASLYTLWLLDTIDPKLKRPLCITFGSPLIGDVSLQEILENSVRNSCFLHVVAAAQTRFKSDFFKPFGTFLICFDSGCVCIEDPEAVTELLNGVHDSEQVDYGQVLRRLDQSMLSIADSTFVPEAVIKGMEKRAEMKDLRFDMFKKLNDMKISMAYIEWYKKECRKVKIGYYDRFKTQHAFPSSEFDIKIKNHKLELNRYWRSVVEEVEKKPQSDISILKRRFLYSGNNYRRMIEPLDIAEYYLEGGKEYRTSGRSRQYVMLEKWFGMELIEKERRQNRDLSDLLTFDSCFWAEVEDSMIVINQLNTTVGMSDDAREALTRKLVKFKEYVWEMIRKREVSPEIFLEKSSFMKWWKEYKKIKGSNSPPSYFTEYMNTGKYESYGKPQ